MKRIDFILIIFIFMSTLLFVKVYAQSVTTSDGVNVTFPEVNGVIPTESFNQLNATCNNLQNKVNTDQDRLNTDSIALEGCENNLKAANEAIINYDLLINATPPQM